MSSAIEQHYMIDLETLGVSPGSVISSIAAVQFDINTGEIGRQFYKNIDLQQSLDNGFTINAETLIIPLIYPPLPPVLEVLLIPPPTVVYSHDAILPPPPPTVDLRSEAVLQ